MTLVCLHGFTGSPTSWDPVLAALRAQGARPLRVLTPTVVGHEGAAATLMEGGHTQVAPVAHDSAPASPPTATSFEDEVDRIARGLPRGTLHLLGYSLGARLALGLAVRHRVRFESITLVGVHPGLVDPAERSARAAADDALADDLERGGLAAFVARWEALPMWASQRRLDPAVLAVQRAQRLQQDPARLAAALRVLSLGRMPSYVDALPTLDLPVTLVVGHADAPFRPRAAAMQERLPLGRVIVVGDDANPIGHNVPLEAPRELARVLSETVDV
ncbi:MAG: alpha/beta fold hydrolase [Polyangiales bacterium]|nr:alpha/beta fold hydrolase [Myxococcales bacterium]MCB9657150.1 alpha/beta fold hydrolase [Sandaracinaceae bacterium]